MILFLSSTASTFKRRNSLSIFQKNKKFDYFLFLFFKAQTNIRNICFKKILNFFFPGDAQTNSLVAFISNNNFAK